ncbi:MAG TPA: hypothetical protein VLT36_12895 [Candidatus Dormibacteraeota bacterium]|nr:hypothetical protein [Candidatus Dormibacteraeota bacterium]
MDSPLPAAPTQTQTWVGILTAVAGAAAVVAKKRFTRKQSSAIAKPALDALNAKLDLNHKEILATIGAQSTAIEKRLDALESAVARLDERTK